MYPNRDEILKGLNDLISTIHKILQAKDQEEAQMQAVAQHNKTATAASGATGDASSALATDNAAQGSAAQSSAPTKPLTAAEILFANFPDDEPEDGSTTVSESSTAGAAPATVAIPQAEVVEDAATKADTETAVKSEPSANVELAATVGEDQDTGVSESLDAPQTEEELAAKALEIRFKLCKHIIMQVDSSLGDFQDMLDTMEYYQDEKYEEARRLVAELEDCTNALIAYLRQHNRY